MIKRIQTLTGLGIFQNYRRDNNLQEFAERNLIYGWNYSGKTTLSRLFSFLEKKEIPDTFAEAEFEIRLYGNNNPEPINQQNILTCPLNVKVFNTDFINDNLRYNTADRKIQGIKFDVGENASLRDTIEVNLAVITETRKLIDANKTYTQKLAEFNDYKFTNIAKHIKNDCFKSAIEFTKTHFKSTMAQLDSTSLEPYIIKDETSLKAIQSIAIAQNNKEPIRFEQTESPFDSIIKEFVRILAYAPGQGSEDPLLSKNQQLYDWVKEGVSLHDEGGITKCAFCGNEINQNRLIFLNQFFTNQAALLKEDIQKLKIEIAAEKESISHPAWIYISPNDIFEGLREQWIEIVDKFNTISNNYIRLLDDLINHLDEKYSTKLFIPIEIEDLDISANTEKDLWIRNIASILEQHNDSVEKFTTIREENRTKYKRHLVASFLKTEKYYEIERKSHEEETKNTEALKLINEKETENIFLQAQLKSITAGKARLNEFIKLFLNREDIQIDTTEDDYFVLKRGDKIACNLSEGEKTAIAFAYFIVNLESIEKDGNLNNYIIFIDDPISSLDANHIAQVSALINSFFFRKATGVDMSDKVVCKVQQLFIATHNFEFYSFLRDASNLKRNRKAIEYINGESVSGYGCLKYFMIKRNSNCSSAIIAMPKYLTEYKSEYVYLFSEIYGFYKSGCPEEQNLLMPNAIRRFLEMYTLTRLPGNTGEIDSRIKEIIGDITELKILHQFSHFTSFERITKHNELLLRLPDVMDDIFTLLARDPQHYNSLLEAIGEVKTTQEPALA